MTSGNVEEEAWVTLATNDTYSLGALTLGKSLQRVGTNRKLVVLITPGVTSVMRERLGEVFHVVQEVNVLDSNDTANLRLLSRPDLGITFTKLHCWKLTQYKKAVFLDADVLVLQNCDELFLREEFSAAPDVGWPDCFNSGVFVFKPSNETYDALIEAALTTGSFDGGDQGLLNVFFNTWAIADIAKHLPFIYNMTSSCAYTYLPAYQQFSKDVKIVHFIGPVKPWMHKLNPVTGHVESVPGAFHAQEHLQSWWNIFAAEVQPRLQPELAGLAGQLSLLSLGQELLQEQKLVDDRARQFAWEQGQADYMGADAFSNIQKKLDETLASSPPEQTPLATEVTSLETTVATTGAGEQAASSSEVISALPSSEVTSSVASVDSLVESLVTTALSPLLIGSATESQKEQPSSDAIIPLPVTPDAHYTTEVSLVPVTGGEQLPTGDSIIPAITAEVTPIVEPVVAPTIEQVATQIQAPEQPEIQAAPAAPIAAPAAAVISAPAPAESAAEVLPEPVSATAPAESAAEVLPEPVSAAAPAESAAEVLPELVSAPAPAEPVAVVPPELVSVPEPAATVLPELVSAPEPVAEVLPELVSAPEPAAEVLQKLASAPPPVEPAPTPVSEPVSAPSESTPIAVSDPLIAPAGSTPKVVSEPASVAAESTPKAVPEPPSALAPIETIQSAPVEEIPIKAEVEPTPLPPAPTSPVTSSPASPTGKTPKSSSKSKTPPASQPEAASQPVAPLKPSKGKVASPPSSQPSTPTTTIPAASSPLAAPSTPQQTQPPAAKKPKGTKKPKSP